MIVVHVTHEAVEKIGGIGAVIAGLVTSKSYKQNVSRTVLVGPLFSSDQPVNRRLGEGGHVIYSSIDGIYTQPWQDRFHAIERAHDVGIVYGTRKIAEPCGGEPAEVEVLLIEVFHSNLNRLNLFKGELFSKFGVHSDQFEKIWEYEEYVRLAEPAYEALHAIGVNGSQDQQVALLAHEYMGMPLALKAILGGSHNTRTVFYAHEVASVRPIVEKRSGHDTMFYNIMCKADGEGRTCEQIFPEVFGNYKHSLVKAARFCDHVFAVGDYIRGELRFLDPHFKDREIDLVYNGIPSVPVTLEEKKASSSRMRDYVEALFNERPTWVFTHVARPVLSKAVWRDLRLLHEMEPLLQDRGETAVYFMLGTLGGQRRPQDVRHMERLYGWPRKHEMGYPDLCGGEEVIGLNFEDFNKNHKASKAVLVNQWDWNHTVCGERMPRDMAFADIRRGSDMEFGMSVYEPFGIAQLESLGFGSLCVVTNICGCMGFARQATKIVPNENVIEANFLHAPEEMNIDQLLGITAEWRNSIEVEECKRLARFVVDRLPRTDEALQKLMETGSALAREMSWEKVVTEYFLPSLRRAAAQ